MSAFSKAGSRSLLFVYELYTQRKNLIKMCVRKMINSFFFALNTLNEAACFVCSQILSKKCEYLLKRDFWICRTKLHSRMAVKKCLGYLVYDSFQNSGNWIFKVIISQIDRHKIFIHYHACKSFHNDIFCHFLYYPHL